MISLSIRLVLSAAGFAVLLALPADAAERKYRQQAKAKPKPMVSWTYTNVRSYGRNTVIFSNTVLGADPDPFIRFGLMQDIGAKFGGSPD
jgi:hypothetical protein